MKAISAKHFIIGLCMLAAAGSSMALKPTARIADKAPSIDLETMIPKQFGDWTIDKAVMPLLANPETEALLSRIYNQTLSRTYTNARGERIMLSIAYGGDQSNAMQVHKPEVCYPAQGFEILKSSTATFSTGSGVIPVRRLVATQGQRIEPITYWTTIGDAVAVNSVKWKLNQLKYGLTGKIPDGLLFRVSSIQSDDTAAYKMQEDFARALLGALTPSGRQRLIGHPAPTT
jgi:EpsI family protein